MRSRRKPVEPRLGRKVGDPIPHATPNPSPSATPREAPSPVASPRQNPSPSPSPTASPVSNPESTALIFSSDASFRSIDLLTKARVRLLDHPALRFLNLNFHRDDRWKESLATKSLRGDFGEEASFDFLAPPLPQSGSSKIVFSSNREGVMQIYVMNADGSNVMRLTYSGANDDGPR
jgi:hypothetical protein